jgi:hypothetical protein
MLVSRGLLVLLAAPATELRRSPARRAAMSMYFEAVVLAANKTALIRLLTNLPERQGASCFIPITLKVSYVAKGRYVVFGWRAGADRPLCGQEMEDLANVLSLEFGKAVAVHYDDQVGVRAAMLSCDGKPAGYFGKPDEVWVPYGEAGNLQMEGPRYPGNALPDDVECDCIWNGIDAALEGAGFRTWIPSQLAAKVAYRAFREDPLWERLGMSEHSRARQRN